MTNNNEPTLIHGGTVWKCHNVCFCFVQKSGSLMQSLKL